MADYRDPEQPRPAGNSPTNIWPNNQPATNIYGVARAGRTAEVTNETIQGPNRGSVGRSGENVPGVQLEAAGPAGSGGAVGGGGRSGGGSSVTGIQGGASGQPLDQLFPRTRSTLRDAGSEISGAIRDGKYATALGSTVGKALKLPETLADDVIGGFGRGAFSLLRNPAEDFGRAVVGLPERPQTPQPSTSAAPTTKPADIKNPYAGANAAKPATGGTNAPAQAGSDSTAIRRIDRPGQSPLFTNMPDEGLLGNNALMGRRSAPTAQNVAAMDALVARDALRSEGAAQSSQYADEVRQAQAINQAEAARRNSWESRVAQWNDPFSGIGLARRNMEVSLGSMTPYHHRGKGGAGDALKEAQMAAYSSLAKEHFGMAAGDRDDATRRYQSDQTLRGNMYQSDQSLRGNIYQADATLGAKQLEQARALAVRQRTAGYYEAAKGNPAKAAQIAIANGDAEAAKTFTEMAQANQTRQYNAATNAQSRLESLAVDPKTGEISKGRLAQVRAAANSAVPGFEQMDEAEQNKHWKTVTAAVKAVQGLNATRDNGLLDFLSPESPALTQLPNVEGRRIERVSPWEGLTTRKVGHGDYKLTKPDAPPLYIPQQNVDENTLGMLKLRGATILDK